MQVTIKTKLFKIKKKLVGAKNVNFKTFTRKIQTNCDEFATLEFIPPKYNKYSDVFEKFEKKFIAKTFWKRLRNRFRNTGKINNRFYL